MDLKNGKTHSKTELQPKMNGNIIKTARRRYCWIGFVGCIAWILITGAVTNGEGQSPSKTYPVSMSSTQEESEVTQTLKELNNPDIESQFRIGLIEKCMESIQSIREDEFEERLKIMKLLFSLKPKLIESIVRPNKRTPLHFAVEEKFENGKQLELIQFLIEHNANVNALDERGNTPLHLAVLFNPSSPELISIIRLLIQNNADPNILDTFGQTFLCTATEKVGPKIFHEIFSYFVMRPNAKMSNIMNMQGSGLNGAS
ncbi:unnamed protein product [Orchesella dallaii]|uniref:Ankyrin repeat domain-containing protein n=1 Tax=Orchesella dallaii TaxID=48710 RepID=A0ABP1RAA6_9HEXA